MPHVQDSSLSSIIFMNTEHNLSVCFAALSDTNYFPEIFAWETLNSPSIVTGAFTICHMLHGNGELQTSYICALVMILLFLTFPLYEYQCSC